MRITKLYRVRQLAALATGHSCKTHGIRLDGEIKYLTGLDDNGEPWVRVEFKGKRIKSLRRKKSQQS